MDENKNIQAKTVSEEKLKDVVGDQNSSGESLDPWSCVHGW